MSCPWSQTFLSPTSGSTQRNTLPSPAHLSLSPRSVKGMTWWTTVESVFSLVVGLRKDRHCINPVGWEGNIWKARRKLDTSVSSWAQIERFEWLFLAVHLLSHRDNPRIAMILKPLELQVMREWALFSQERNFYWPDKCALNGAGLSFVWNALFPSWPDWEWGRQKVRDLHPLSFLPIAPLSLTQHLPEDEFLLWP